MKTAVVILNWNTRDYLRRFLPPLIESCAGMDAEVIVADNASTDGSMELLRESFPQLRTVALDSNYGFTGGYNKALARIEAEYYVLINSDVEVGAGWLAPLVRWMDDHPGCAACAPKLMSWHDRGRFEYAGAAGGCIDALGYTFCRGRVLNRVEEDKGQYDTPRDVFWVSGACMMIRSSLWHECGGLDERFFAHMEEIDLCWRLHLRGYVVSVVPQSRVYHLGGGTLPQDSPWKLELNYRNNLLMLHGNLHAQLLACGYSPARARFVATLRILLRYLLDDCSAAVYLLCGKPRSAAAVMRGHRGYRRMKRLPRPGRQEDRPACRDGARPAALPAGYYHGSILWACLVKGDGIFDYLAKKMPA